MEHFKFNLVIYNLLCYSVYIRGENMLAKIMSYGFWGIDGYEVKVEIDINAGIPGYDVVGLADTAVKESKERVRAAIKNSGFIYNKFALFSSNTKLFSFNF